MSEALLASKIMNWKLIVHYNSLILFFPIRVFRKKKFYFSFYCQLANICIYIYDVHSIGLKWMITPQHSPLLQPIFFFCWKLKTKEKKKKRDVVSILLLQYVDLDEFLSENGIPVDGVAGGGQGTMQSGQLHKMNNTETPGHQGPAGLHLEPVTKRERSPSPSECCSPDTMNPPSPADSSEWIVHPISYLIVWTSILRELNIFNGHLSFFDRARIREGLGWRWCEVKMKGYSIYDRNSTLN